MNIKRLFEGFLMSLGMFSIFPIPHIWNKNAVNLIIPFLPVVGAIIGLFWWVLSLAAVNLSLVFSSVIIMLIPFFLSGFIHIDGYMDTSDALFSRRSMEEKRKILKDSNVGAFAVIMLAVLFFLSYAAVTEILMRKVNLLMLLFIPIVSRSMVGLIMLRLRTFSQNGYAAAFKNNSKSVYSAVLLIYLAIVIITAFALLGVKSFFTISLMVLVSLLTAFYLYRQFGGISGDLCGCTLVITELCGLISLSFTGAV